MYKKENTRLHKLNNEIRYPSVRLVGFYDDTKILSIKDALVLANENDKDLILINDNQEIPIVKIENYKKFLYNLEKQNKEKKKNTKKTELKEIQLSTGIADNDLNTKSRKAREFLTNGNKVKCTLMLKGREKYVPERGQIIMLKFADSLVDIAIPDNMPKLENNHWMMILHQIPKK